ncbi:RNA-directed DNA polymerase [Synechocystis sp. FACHB-383]|uniref:RNA-directed DNA polymerase n=1 Tax=Synechocystis sp. FACHB-383 TaxID=2692864 RepID=UPI0016824878|nr:RNA-directed DNA polymerase [Synechocystis sp. FACHB-383]MBD2652545.1 RNA-directed DNA polymerase [Synechocystis sp. FACHB-383]
MKNLELKNLIGKGYFPKELPPPFNTLGLAEKVNEIILCWNNTYSRNTEINSPEFALIKNPEESNKNFKKRKKEYRDNFISQYNSSSCICFSISKGKFSRRFLGIPNPKHFILLSEKIADNWRQIQDIFKESQYSKSFPVPEETNNRAVRTNSKSVSDFITQRINASFNKLIEIRVDISKFYPTIYTHSITWAFLGKRKAKYYFNNKQSLIELIDSGDDNAILYTIADEIDNCIRGCQDRQSIGIPIGPDTSHIIAEIIACRIDNILHEKFQNIDLKGCRFYDDYHLFVKSKDQADQVLKTLQKILNDFQLEINEAKVKIRESPFLFEDEFSYTLSQFKFNDTKTEYSIKRYFSLIWRMIEREPSKSDTISKYALKTFEFGTIEISKENWKLFETLLLATVLIQPAVLDITTRILLSYKDYLDQDSKNKLKEIIEEIIKNHSQMNHDFEVSWSLWLAKTFEITIEQKTVDYVFEMNNAVSLLILLDITKTTQLIQGNSDFTQIESELDDNALLSEHWLLVYEGIKKGWLVTKNPNFLEDNHFFKILKDFDIEFYNPSGQLHLYTFPSKLKTEKTGSTKKNGIHTNEDRYIANHSLIDIQLSNFY